MTFRNAQRRAALIEYVIGAALLGVVLVFVLDLQNRNDLELRAKTEAEGQAQFIQRHRRLGIVHGDEGPFRRLLVELGGTP